MAVFIVAEAEFRKSTWCADIIRGITESAKKSRLSVMTEDIFSPEAKSVPKKDDLIAVIAHNPYKTEQLVMQSRSLSDAYIVVAGAECTDHGVSSVYTDTANSVKSVLEYLSKDCGKTSPALYGVNPSLAADLKKLAAFPEKSRVYYSRDNLSECFRSFSGDLEKYDSVICTNDYSAISLVNSLAECGVSKEDFPFIVSLANTKLCECASPSVTSVTNSEYLLGEAVVSIYAMLLRENGAESLSVCVKSGIMPRETTKFIPFTRRTAHAPSGQKQIPTLFYNDLAVESLIKIEKLLSGGNSENVAVISMLAEGKSYEEIAEVASLSVSGVKYRVKQYVEKCGLSSGKELRSLARKVFFGGK